VWVFAVWRAESVRPPALSCPIVCDCADLSRSVLQAAMLEVRSPSVSREHEALWSAVVLLEWLDPRAMRELWVGLHFASSEGEVMAELPPLRQPKRIPPVVRKRIVVVVLVIGMNLAGGLVGTFLVGPRVWYLSGAAVLVCLIGLLLIKCPRCKAFVYAESLRSHSVPAGERLVPYSCPRCRFDFSDGRPL
jgi:hypothetical protein